MSIGQFMRRRAQFMCEAQFMTAGQFMRLAAIHVPQGQFTAKPIHAQQSAIHACRLPSHRKRSPLPGKGGSTTSRYRAPLVRGAVCKADRGVVISQSIHAPQGAVHARSTIHDRRSIHAACRNSRPAGTIHAEGNSPVHTNGYALTRGRQVGILVAIRRAR